MLEQYTFTHAALADNGSDLPAVNVQVDSIQHTIGAKAFN
jgi:hypothetical protein